MAPTVVPKDSAEYAKIVSEVFAEVVRRSTIGPSASSADITPALLQALEYIFLHGSSPIRKIAAGLSVSVSAASQLVDRLVHKELVTRVETEQDRRQAAVDLTDRGRELISRSRQERTEWMENVLAGMTKERRNMLVESLEEFIRIAISAEQDIESACVHCGVEHLAFCVLNKAYQEATGRQITDY